MISSPGSARDRADRCPGVLRPWPAADGGLVRLRLIGGVVPVPALVALAEVASRYGEPGLHLTRRANLQLRGLPVRDGELPGEVVDALRETGLLPSPAHELVRNVMVSPLTGILGGQADLRGAAVELDRLLCADPELAGLPGRFLFVLDDGRGDLVDRPLDLGLVAVDSGTVQLRAGTGHWGSVVDLDRAPAAVIDLARAFLAARGAGTTAAWHTDELVVPLTDLPRDPRTEVRSGRPAYGFGPGYEHRAVPDGVLTPAALAELAEQRSVGTVVVTPWHGLLLPEH